MFYIFALIFVGAVSDDPAGIMKSETSYESKAACQLALKSSFVEGQNEKLKARFTALGKKRNIKFAFKFECREAPKEDDGSI